MIDFDLDDKVSNLFKNRRYEAIERLCLDRYKINKPFKYGQTLLIYAAKHKMPSIASLLLLGGADLNAKCDKVPYLIKKGVPPAQIEFTPHTKYTAMHWSALNGNMIILKMLVENGADIGAVDAEISTPMHWAAAKGALDVIEYLLEKGNCEKELPATKRCLSISTHNYKFKGPRAIDISYLYPIDFAIKYRHSAVVKVLEQYKLPEKPKQNDFKEK